jgi:sigma-B regulation protein RsbU (phosphoserine phosphatase)
VLLLNDDLMTSAIQINDELTSQLALARQVQLGLLPERRCCLSNWEFAFSYEPAGFVSGDYVDLIPSGADEFYFALGDVSGKGVAASILMSHLHATLRTLLPSGRTIAEVLALASRTFCQSTLPAQFATLVLGKADRRGNLELVNAGHTPVLLVEDKSVHSIAGTNLPLGMFCATEFMTANRKVGAGSTLLLYSDGITESTNDDGMDFDLTRAVETLVQSGTPSPPEIVDAIRRGVDEHTDGAPPRDDRTILALRWLPKGI